MTEPFEKPFLAPTLAHWEKRLSRLAVGMVTVALLTWAGAFWSLVDNGIDKTGFMLLSSQTSVFLPLVALIVAVLPDVITGVVRPRDRTLTFVFVASAVLGGLDAIGSLAAAALRYGDQYLGRTTNFFFDLANIALALIVAALALTALSDARFVPRLGGFRPPPPRPDSGPLPG